MSEPYYIDEAQMLAYKAWNTLRLTPPADLYRVAQSLKLDVCEREFVDAIDGVYVRLPDGRGRIGLNSIYTKPISRRSFTFAHEIGHHLLSRRINPGKQLFFVDTSKQASSITEKACDRFAALLLMPEDLIRHHYSELEHNPENRLSILAERFGVSAWAMRRRLRELGLQVSFYRRQ